MDAHEGRDVTIFEILGEYIHIETDKDVIIFMELELAEIMVKISPKIYLKYGIMSSKGKPLLYVQIKKALYGLIRSALLFWRNLVKYLEAYGLQINQYDPYVTNNMINKKYMTILSQVDDINLSHVDSFEISKFLGYM